MVFEKEKIIRILTFYNIGNLLDIKETKGGLSEDNSLEIITTKGKYYLRSKHRNWQIKKIRNLNWFLYRLKQRGFPVARPILTKNHRTIVEMDDQIYSIYEFVEGKVFLNYGRFSIKKFNEAVYILARLHKITLKVPPEHKMIIDCKNLYLIDRLWKSHSEYGDRGLSTLYKIQIKKQRFELTDIDKEVLKYIPFVKAEFNLFLADLEFVRERPNLSIVHDDFHAGNLIMQENRVAALIDFDVIKMGLAEYDLVKSALRFSFWPSRIGYNLNKLKLFVTAYKTVFGKIDLEPREVMAFLRHNVLVVLVGNLDDVLFENQIKNGVYAVERCFKELKWIKRKEKFLIDVFTN